MMKELLKSNALFKTIQKQSSHKLIHQLQEHASILTQGHIKKQFTKYWHSRMFLKQQFTECKVSKNNYMAF